MKMDKRGSREIRQSRVAGRWKKRKTPNPHVADTEYASTSAEKLRGRRSIDIQETPEFKYCILEFVSVFAAISASAICNVCQGNLTFTQGTQRGAGFEILMKCECSKKSISSCPFVKNAYEINRRLVFVFRLLGIGFEGLNKFCGLMDICNGMARNTYYGCVENVRIATAACFQMVLRKAVHEEKEKNVENGHEENHLIVSGDGTWKKRGFSSSYGVSTIIGIYSKKVVDAIVKSSFCQACTTQKRLMDPNDFETWYADHEEQCLANHEGSAGKMEVDGITEMFQRSVEIHGVKYATYVGDGDSKTYKGIISAQPYDDIIVKKKECVGHVEKRMGRRLRKLKQTTKGLGGKGKGKLIDPMIGKLSKYYGLAIRKNPKSIKKMRDAIWATFYHYSSSDDNPQHSLCPPGNQSWCKWRKAEATGQLSTYKQEYYPLCPVVLENIKPIYEDLTSEDLLERCIGAYTQNSNECLNSCIWLIAPKHLNSGKVVVDIATYVGVMLFNEGYRTILQAMNAMGITVGPVAVACADRLDRERITYAEKSVTDGAKKARIDARESKVAERESFLDEEGELYGPGIAD